MASIIKANQLQDFGGNSILTSDGAGVVTPNASGIKMTPSFSAYLSSAQSVTDATWTKIQFNTEVLDSDGTYDNSTNYRFTPASTGYYLINAGVSIQADSTNTMGDNYLALYKNGTSVSTSSQYGNTTNKSSW